MSAIIAIIIETCSWVHQPDQGSHHNHRADPVCRPKDNSSFHLVLIVFEGKILDIYAYMQYLTSGIGRPGPISCTNGINISPSCAVKPEFDVWLLLNCERVCLFVGACWHFLAPASAVKKSSGAITGDSGTKSRDLLFHSGFMLHATRDVRPCSVVLIKMLDYCGTS